MVDKPKLTARERVVLAAFRLGGVVYVPSPGAVWWRLGDEDVTRDVYVLRNLKFISSDDWADAKMRTYRSARV